MRSARPCVLRVLRHDALLRGDAPASGKTHPTIPLMATICMFSSYLFFHFILFSFHFHFVFILFSFYFLFYFNHVLIVF